MRKLKVTGFGYPQDTAADLVEVVHKLKRQLEKGSYTASFMYSLLLNEGYGGSTIDTAFKKLFGLTYNEMLNEANSLPSDTRVPPSNYGWGYIKKEDKTTVYFIRSFDKKTYELCSIGEDDQIKVISSDISLDSQLSALKDLTKVVYSVNKIWSLEDVKKNSDIFVAEDAIADITPEEKEYALMASDLLKAYKEGAIDKAELIYNGIDLVYSYAPHKASLTKGPDSLIGELKRASSTLGEEKGTQLVPEKAEPIEEEVDVNYEDVIDKTLAMDINEETNPYESIFSNILKEQLGEEILKTYKFELQNIEVTFGAEEPTEITPSEIVIAKYLVTPTVNTEETEARALNLVVCKVDDDSKENYKFGYFTVPSDSDNAKLPITDFTAYIKDGELPKVGSLETMENNIHTASLIDDEEVSIEEDLKEDEAVIEKQVWSDESDKPVLDFNGNVIPAMLSMNTVITKIGKRTFKAEVVFYKGQIVKIEDITEIDGDRPLTAVEISVIESKIKSLNRPIKENYNKLLKGFNSIYKEEMDLEQQEGNKPAETTSLTPHVDPQVEIVKQELEAEKNAPKVKAAPIPEKYSKYFNFDNLPEDEKQKIKEEGRLYAEVNLQPEFLFDPDDMYEDFMKENDVYFPMSRFFEIFGTHYKEYIAMIDKEYAKKDQTIGALVESILYNIKSKSPELDIDEDDYYSWGLDYTTQKELYKALDAYLKDNDVSLFTPELQEELKQLDEKTKAEANVNQPQNTESDIPLQTAGEIIKSGTAMSIQEFNKSLEEGTLIEDLTKKQTSTEKIARLQDGNLVRIKIV